MLVEIRTSPNAYRPSCPKQILVLRCDQCLNNFERPYTQDYLERHKWGQFCSRSCYGQFKSEHPELYAANTAAMHTSEVATKISESRLMTTRTPEYVHSQTGLKRSEETKALLRQRKAENPLVGEKNGMWGRKHKVSSRNAMSEAQSMMLLTGKKRPYGGNSKKGEYVSSKTGKQHFFKSGWELALMKWFDMAPNIEMWDYECVRIPYYYNEHKRWYVPDFLVTYSDGHLELWEVKPKEFMTSEKNVLKTEAAQAWCKENNVTAYRVMTGEQLQTMQVI